MNISENLQLLLDTKEAIRQAINDQGVALESGAPFSAYSQAILSIETGSTPDTGDTPSPTPEYTYAISMDGGATFGNGELDGGWDYGSSYWVKNYVELHYGSGDWENYDFVSSGIVSPSDYYLADNPDDYGVQDYDCGYDDEQQQWYVCANGSTPGDSGEFFSVKAIDNSNDEDISGATLHVNIGTVDEDQSGGDDPGELPADWYELPTEEGSYEFADEVMMTQFDPEGTRYQSAWLYCYDTYPGEGEEMPTPVASIVVNYDTRTDGDTASADMTTAGGSYPWVSQVFLDENDGLWHARWQCPSEPGIWYFYNDVETVTSLSPNE